MKIVSVLSAFAALAWLVHISDGIAALDSTDVCEDAVDDACNEGRDQAAFLQVAQQVHAASGNATETERLSTISTAHVLQHPSMDKIDKWIDPTFFEGTMYASDFGAGSLLTYDTESGHVSGISTLEFANASLKSFRWCGTAALAGKIYSSPQSADVILVYDPQARKLSSISTDSVAIGPQKWCGMTAYEGKLYSAPHSQETMLIYDPETGALSGVSTAGIQKPPGGYWWCPITAYKGKVYAPPLNSNHLLIYDIESRQLSGIPTTSVSTGSLLWEGIAAFDDKIYAPPLCADKMLVYDTVTGQLSGISTAALTNGHPNVNQWGGMAALGGKLYAAPKASDVILVYDPKANHLSGIDVMAAAPACAAYAANCVAGILNTSLCPQACFEKWGMLAAQSGKLYLPPLSMEDILVYDVL